MDWASTNASIPAATAPEVNLKVAATRLEREMAFGLIYRAYERAGLCESNSLGQRHTPYQLLPTTDIFVAILRNEVISTLSLVRDGELGLPMEQIYADTVADRRAAGLRLAEVSCLADRRSGIERFFGLFCDLSRVMVQLACREGIDQLLIAVHPRHAAIYRRYMAFRQIGQRKDYELVCGNPAVPLCLDLNEIAKNRPKSWERFFGDPLPPSVLQTQPIATDDREYFEQLTQDEKQARCGHFDSYASREEQVVAVA